MKRKEINRMKLEFNAISQNEAFARQTLSVFAASADPTVEEISDLRVVISEAVTNTVVHAYKNRGGKVIHRSRKNSLFLNAIIHNKGRDTSLI